MRNYSRDDGNQRCGTGATIVCMANCLLDEHYDYQKAAEKTQLKLLVIE